MAPDASSCPHTTRSCRSTRHTTQGMPCCCRAASTQTYRTMYVSRINDRVNALLIAEYCNHSLVVMLSTFA